MGTIEGLYGWLRNITCYILFMSILDNLLPGKKYGKYLKLFAGMVLILLVVQPFTGSLRLEDRIAHYYESFVFRYQADDLKQEILGMEEQRLDQMIAQYEGAVEQDLILMAEDSGLTAVECRAVIERDQEAERFGMVQSIRMKVRPEDREAGEAASAETRAAPEVPVAAIEADISIAPVETVAIGEEGTQNNISGGSPGETVGEDGASRERERERQEEERTAVRKLRRKIASYYNLEEAYVEIQVVEGQR